MANAAQDTKYNGFANYETWAVSLWLGNDEPTYIYWRDAAACFKDVPDRQEAALSLADRLKQELTEDAPDLGCTLWSDLLGAALSEVNWYEVATNLLEP